MSDRWNRLPLLKRFPPVPRPEDYRSPLHSTRLAAIAGAGLGVCVLVCFLTGLYSHFLQHPLSWLPLPRRPVWIYGLTQGIHVATGIAAIPLLGLKLWVVTPRFWRRLTGKSLSARAIDALERLSVLVLIASVAFELISGLLNVAEFYPWSFFFPAVHFAVAPVAIGAILIHLAVKLPAIRSRIDRGPGPTVPQEKSTLSRRGLILTGAAAVGAVTVATVGDRISGLADVSVLAQRSGAGPQGLPVNRSAAAAGVRGPATDPGYRLTIVREGRPVKDFDLAGLARLPQSTVSLPIACVEGWTRYGAWTGPSLAQVLAAAGIEATGVQVVSLDPGLYGRSAVSAAAAADPLTLLALRLNGQVLALDHGYPVRLIAPARPGAMQTKWLTRIEVS